MDPITLIVTALAAVAVSGVMDSASSAVKDAYASLKALVRKRLAGRPDAELVLARHEQAPETWQAPLAAVLDDAGAGRDADVVAAHRLCCASWTRRGRPPGSTRSMSGARRAFRSATGTGRTTSSTSRRAVARTQR